MGTAKLYWAKGTCSLASMTALTLAGVPFEAEEVALHGPRSNLPNGTVGRRVPVLEHADGLLSETIAILFWAHAMRRREALLPDGAALPAAVSRLAWLTSRVHPIRRQYARPANFDADPAVQRSLSAGALPKYRAELDDLERAVRDGEMSALALSSYALIFYFWAKIDGLLSAEHSSLRNLAESLARRPGVGEAIRLHGFDVEPA